MSLPPTVMRRLMRELSELKKSPPEGIRVQTSDDNILDVTGIIEGPEGTPYAGGFFKVKFKFTEEFPAAPPKCWFATKIFHPNVSTAGEICVNTLKKDWKSSYGISHILVTVKCLLIYPNPESALDEEAGKLLLENYDSYCDRAKLITSVHATPRVRPVEFDTPTPTSTSSPSTPASSSTSSATASSSKLPPTALPPLPTGPIFSLPLTTTPNQIASLTRKSASPAPQSQHPLKSSPSNNAPSSEKDSNNKERLTSPSPLSTADANVAGGTGNGKTAGMGGMGAAGSGAAAPTKAVKRAATGGGATGAEKRKKALKRL